MQKISGRATRVLGTRVHSGAPAKRKARATVVDTTERVRGTTIAPAAKADTVLEAGVNAALGFDYDAAAAGVRASLATFIAADTTNPPGNEARVIDLIAAALSKEGVEFQVTEFAPGRKSLVATLKGSGEAKPLVLLAHTDVVGTDGQPWSTPPHVLTDKGDGYLYGRGTRDDLLMVAANLEMFLMLKRAGVQLKRDVIIAFGGDEENGSAGMRDLLAKVPALKSAGLVINEGASLVNTEIGGPVRYGTYEVAQKYMQDFEVTANGTTGHSSVPRDDNAISRLGAALGRLGATKQPARLNEVTRAYLRERAKVESPEVAKAMTALANADGALPADALAVLEKNPGLSAQLRTTLVATLISGGTKNNALPASATADINARILPDESIDDTEAWLRQTLNDPSLVITRKPPIDRGPASPVDGEFATSLRKILGDAFPSAPLIPTMQTGFTDSRYFRALGIPAYGFNPFPGLEADGPRSHGIDERTQVASFRVGVELYMRLITDLAAKA